MIYMVGHSNHPWPYFLGLLKQHGITDLVDVRTKPNSRFGQFCKGPLTRNLPEAGISYRNVEILGGKDPKPVTEMMPYIEALGLASLLPPDDGINHTEKRICLMCSEGNPEDCHRHYFLTELFIKAGYPVTQILKDGTLRPDTGPSAKIQKKFAASMPAGFADPAPALPGEAQ